MYCVRKSRVCAMLTCMAVLSVPQMAEAQTTRAQTFRRVATDRAVRPQRGTPPSSYSKGFQAQRFIISQIPGGQVAEKPLPQGSSANAPVILRGSVIEKRSITIRFRNKAANVSLIKVERKSKNDKSWKLLRTYKINVHRSAIVPSKIDLGSKPDATYTFRDSGLTPDMPYRYRVTAMKSVKPYPRALVSAVRTITTKPLELPAAPSRLEGVYKTETTLSVKWNDNSDNERGFSCYYRVHGTSDWTGKDFSRNITNGVITNLKSDTYYDLKVKANTSDGSSKFSNILSMGTEGSNSSTPTSSTEISRTINLVGQPLGNAGTRPFTARWPFAGTLSGRLTKIEIPKVGFGPTYYIYFVKPGYSTADCETNPDASVMLKTGQTSTSSQLNEIFGNSQPKLPVRFLACIGTSQGIVPDLVPIKITYIKTD